METKNQLDTSLVFDFFKYKTSDNFIGWEPMRDNASPKYQILVTSMDIHQDANNYMQKTTKSLNPLLRYWWFISENLGMLEDTQLKQHDNTVAFLDV